MMDEKSISQLERLVTMETKVDGLKVDLKEVKDDVKTFKNEVVTEIRNLDSKFAAHWV